MATVGRALKTDRLYLRLSRRQREIIDEAARASEKDVSGFVLDAALANAQQVLMDRRSFTLTGERWGRFVKMLDKPVAMGRKPRLEKLLREPSVFEAKDRRH